MAKLLSVASIDIPAGVSTIIDDLVSIDAGATEIGIQVEIGDVIYWSIDGVAVIGKAPITPGLLSFDIRVAVAKLIQVITTNAATITIIQVGD